MGLSSIRKYVKSWFATEASARRRSFRPRFERLEDRDLPSTFLVTNDLDGGPGSLRDAISKVNLDASNLADTIRFASTLTGPSGNTIYSVVMW